MSNRQAFHQQICGVAILEFESVMKHVLITKFAIERLSSSLDGVAIAIGGYEQYLHHISLTKCPLHTMPNPCPVINHIHIMSLA